jgi:hypothetical protein
MTKVFGILPLIRAFISEHTFYKNGKIAESGAIGANFKIDLNVFLLVRMTSIYVDTVIIYGDITGFGRDPIMVFCNYLIIL